MLNNELKWYEKVKKYYKAGITNMFYIYGNTTDYADIERYFFSKEHITKCIKGSICSIDEIIDGNNINIRHGLNNAGTTQYVKIKNEIEKGNAYFFWAEKLSSFKSLLTDKEVLKSNHLILIFGQNLESDFSDYSHVQPIEVPYPDEDDRLAYIKSLVDNEKRKVLNNFYPDKNVEERITNTIKSLEKDNPKENLKAFARLTAGLTKRQIEDVWLLSLSEGVFNYELIIDRKKDIIQKEFGDVIEIYDSNNLSLKDYSGQKHIKSYLKEVVIEPIFNGNINIIPKGIMFSGPPGTGKTYLANCLAGEAKLNFIELKMSKIYDMWVGNSEKRFNKAMTCIRSLYPVIVFIDEIDQVFQRNKGHDDSGGARVDGQLFGMFLSILSDPNNRGKIIWIAATNYPNRVDEALKRTGRFDKKIPFLPPNFEDRKETFRIVIKKNKVKGNLTDEDYSFLASGTEGYVQSDIEQVVVKALELMYRENTKEITIEHLKKALDYIIKSDSENIQEMIEIALSECNDKELMPPEYWDKM